jgi:hypothetical protein
MLALQASSATAAAQKYLNPQFADLASTHRIVAILPFQVTIAAKNLPKNVTPEMLHESEQQESAEFQRQLFARFLQRAANGEYSISFQDVDHTNTLLQRNGWSMDSLSVHTKDEIAAVLGVDALVSGSIRMARPTSTGTAIVQSVLFGFSGSTERVDINMVVHNGSDGTLLWSYDHTDKGGLANSPEAMTKSLLKKVAGNFPYKVRR